MSAPEPPAAAGIPPPGKRRRVSLVPAAVQAERRRLAAELHDHLCQELTGISLLAHAAARRQHEACPEAERQLQEIAGMLQTASANLRAYIRTLCPDG